MIAKNKLYKHHKSKTVLVFRNFSILFSGLIAIAAIVAIPTYINASRISETKANESTIIENKNEVVDNLEKSQLEEELLSIN